MVREMREFQALAVLEDTELLQVWQSTQEVWANQFLDSLMETGCARWEKILVIQPKLSDTLEVRRFRIKTRLNEDLPYTYRVLEQALEALCGSGNYALVLKPQTYSLKILLELTIKKLVDEVEAMARRMVPANMVLEVLLRYNQWQDYAQTTWNSASGYTWKQLREEEI